MKKVGVLNFSGVTKFVTKIWWYCKQYNSTVKSKRNCQRNNETCSKTALSLSDIVFWKDEINIEKTSAGNNSQLNDFCRQKMTI